MMSTVTGVRIELLGGFRVVIDGRTIDESTWPGRRAVELVQLLALHPGRRLVRDQVIDVLWPHLGVEAGGANLRKAAHHARRTLGVDDAVVLRAGQVALFPDRDDIVTDLSHFEALAQAALAGGDARRCAEAIDAYGGELLPHARYEDWTADARRHAHARHLDLLRATGRWDQVVEVEPTDEEAYAHLMRAALHDGLRPGALRWFARARVALASELGLVPGPALQALHDEAVEGIGADVPTLVGRDADMARVGAALVAEGSGTVFVRGPAGIGKTALCREVTAAPALDGRAVRWLTATAGGAALAPLTRLVDDLLLGSKALLAAVGPHVRTVLATLAHEAAVGAEPGLQVSRHEVVGAVTQLLRACADGQCTVVVLDDAHLADEATLDVLHHLATSVADVTVLLALRPQVADPVAERAVVRLRRTTGATVVDLAPLDAPSARDLAASVAPGVGAEELESIVARGEGNPFAVVELARRAGSGSPVAPATVGEAILARLADVDADTLDTLGRLALAGDDLDVTTATALAGGTAGASDEALDRALAAGVLVVTDGRYRFQHDLVRVALAEQIPPHRQAAIHADAAERLATSGAAPAAIATQWLAAGRVSDAGPWLLAAARRAIQLGAFADARRHLVPLLEAGPDVAALRLDAEALDLLGDPSALVAYDAAIAVAAPADAHDLVAMRALAQVKQGDPAGALAAIAGAEPTSVAGRLSQALAYAGAAALGATDPAAGSALAAACRRIALESGDRGSIVIASWAQAAAAHARGELRDSVLADLRDTSDLPDLAVRVFDGHLCITQRLLYGSRPYDDVIAFADEFVAEARRLGALRGQAFGVTLRGEAELLSGRLDEAESDLTEAIGLHRRTGGATGEAHALQRLAEVAMHRGDRERASALLAEALDLARTTDIGFHLLDRIYGTRIALAGDPEEALATVAEAEASVRGPLETCPGCRITFTVPAAIASARAGAIDEAEALAEASAYLAHVVMRLPAWDAAHDEVLAHLAFAKGDPVEGCARSTAAADAFAAAGQPLDERRCRDLAAAT